MPRWRAVGVARLPLAPEEVEAAEQRRWLRWFGLPAVVGAVCLGLTFGTGQMWYLAIGYCAFLVDLAAVIWLGLTTSDGGPDAGRGASSH